MADLIVLAVKHGDVVSGLQDLNAQLLQHILGNGLDVSQGPHRHKDRGLDGAMRQVEDTASCSTGSSDDFKAQRHLAIIVMKAL